MKRLTSAAVVLGLVAVTGWAGFCAGRAERPYLSAEIALRRGLLAAATGATDPAIKFQFGMSDSLAQLRDILSHPYTLEFVDNYLAGTGWKDIFAPGWLVWNVRFDGGPTFEANVLATSDSTWIVSLASRPIQ